MRDYPTQRQSGMAHPTGSVVGSSSPVSPIEKGSKSCSGQGRGRGGAVISSGSPNRIFALTSQQNLEHSSSGRTRYLFLLLAWSCLRLGRSRVVSIKSARRLRRSWVESTSVCGSGILASLVLYISHSRTNDLKGVRL